MLSSIISILERAQIPLSQDVLCDKLGISPQLLSPMLDTLVRMGKLEPIPPASEQNCTACSQCPIQPACGSTIAFTGTCYRLTSAEK